MYLCRFTYAVILAIITCAGLAAAEPAPKKLSVPAEADVATMQKTVGDLYESQLDAAKTPDLKAKLGAKIFADAEGTRDDSVARYVLYRAARKLAAAGGNFELAVRVAESLTGEYNVDEFSTQLELVNDSAPLVKSPESAYLLARYARRAQTAAVAANRYDVALPLATAAAEAAKLIRDADISKQYQEERTRITKAAAEWEKVKPLAAVLDMNPADPAANAALGKFYCFVHGNLAKGLPMLALGDDAALKGLAAQDLKAPAEPAARLALGDAWYDAAQTQDPNSRAKLLGRAGYWYRREQQNLTGLSRTRVDNRVKEADAASSPYRVGEWVEVLDYLESNQNPVRAPWQWRVTALWLPAHGGVAVLALPIIPSGGYELRFRFTGDDSHDFGNVYLPFDKNSCWLGFNGWRDQGGPLSAIDVVNQKGGWDPSNPSRVGALSINPGRPVTLSVLVEPDADVMGISVAADGKPYLKWRGPRAALGAWPGHAVPAQGQLGLAATSRTLLIHSVRFKLNSGTARLPD